jgi:hypothetical protein
MVNEVKILGYRVYVVDKDYLYYDTEETAIAAAKMFATESRKTKATVVMEVEVWNSGQN